MTTVIVIVAVVQTVMENAETVHAQNQMCHQEKSIMVCLHIKGLDSAHLLKLYKVSAV